MAVERDIETIGFLALFGVLAIWLISAFSKQFQSGATSLGEAIGGAASNATGAAIQGIQQAAGNVGSGVVQTVQATTNRTGTSLGNWIWDLWTKINPSALDTSADPSQINWLSSLKAQANASNGKFQQTVGDLLWQTDYGTENGVKGIMSGADYIPEEPLQTLDVSRYASDVSGWYPVDISKL